MHRLLIGFVAGIVVAVTWTAAASADPQQSLDPLVAAPQHFHLEFENQYVRVIREHTGPRDKVPMHQHTLGGVMVLLADQDIHQTLPDGSTRDLHRKAGDTFWTDPQTHSGENMNDKPFEYVRIEIKAATRPLNSQN